MMWTMSPCRLLAVLAFVVAVLSLSSCSDQDVYTVQTKVAPDGSVVRKPQLTTVARLRESTAAKGPKVRVDNPTHDFGCMDPLTQRSHTFVIRNVGDAPLELEQGPTTCKCTLSGLTDRQLMPGDKAHVVVKWNSGRDLKYAHSAKIYTNDPANPVVDLVIKGTVVALFRCEPEEIVFSRVAPGQTPSASTVLYSQVWDEIDFSDIRGSLQGLTWRIEEADAAEKSALGARSAYRVSVTLPSDLPEGYFNAALHVQGRAKYGQDDRNASCDVTVAGKVLRRLAVYGPDIDADGTVHLGRVPQGQGVRTRLLLKLRDEQRELVARRFECLPPSLKVHIEPHKVDADAELGLYYLHVELPKDAPTFRLPPDRNGYIRIEFDHPRVGVLELPVDLIVVPRDDFTAVDGVGAGGKTGAL